MLREIKTLGGTDCNRKPVTLVVDNDARGVPHDPYTGKTVYITGRSVLMGWGDLDGPSFTLSTGHDVPQDVWKKAYPRDFVAHNGGRYEDDDE